MINNIKLPEHKPLALAVILGVMSFVGFSLVGVIFYLSQSKIADNQRLAELQLLQQVLPTTLYDNDIVNDKQEVSDPLLGENLKATVYRARLAGQPTAVIINTTTFAGYNGTINLLVGIKKNGELAGVRVISHQETPGLGDKIDSSRSDWILSFEKKSLINPTLSQWQVKRDGGYFDQFSGATITPRAIVNAVKNTLLYYQSHQTELF